MVRRIVGILSLALLALPGRALAQWPSTKANEVLGSMFTQDSNFGFPPYASDPFTCNSLTRRTVYYNTTTNTTKFCDGTTWTSLVGTNGFSCSGTACTATVPLLLPDGTVSDPGSSFAADTNAGMYRSTADDTLVLTNGGWAQLRIGPGGGRYVTLESGSTLGWAAAVGSLGGDLIIGREAAATLQQGTDAATATAQVMKGPDSTGANVTGGNLTLRPGAGTAGNATGGQLILAGGARAGSGERGAVAIEDGGTKPTCAAGIRGSLWYDAGGAGVADTFEICAKQAAGDTYAWRVAATIP